MTQMRSVTSLPKVALLRLVAQRIAGPRCATVTETVRWLTGMQAQDFRGVLTSVALRTEAGTRADVEAAFNAGQIVRSWPMRGTLHVVAAEDLPWMVQTAAPRVLAGATARYAQLGLSTASFDRAEEIALQALAGGEQMTRAELFACWTRAGVDASGQRGYHLLWQLAQTGVVCLGPVRGGEQLVVLVADWVAHPRRLERTEALGEWAERYFRSHGPATVADFARWTNMTMADARAGLALARPRLSLLEVDGVEYLLDPQTPDLLAAYRDHAGGIFLLSGFDEFVLGYRDRTAALPAEFADRIVPGGNGMFRSTVVSAGQIVGTWKQAGRGPARTVAATPFTSFAPGVAEAISTAYAELP